ncbi:MAG: glycosyltransferase, partial [Candidatus Dormibacteraceae bacterium]
MLSDAVCRVAVLSLHTSPSTAPGRGASGGLNVYVRELSRALGERGVASDVLVRVGANRPARRQPLGEGCTLVPVPAGPDRDLSPSEERDLAPALARAVGRVVAGQGYDVLASHHWMSGVVAANVAGSLDAPFVHTAHTWAVLKNQTLAPGAAPEPEWREGLERDVARAADRILVATLAERDLLVRWYGAGSRCALVVPGVDVEAFAPGEGPVQQPPTFLVAGRLERLKGVDTALAALAELRHPTARLQVVGEDGGERGEQG